MIEISAKAGERSVMESKVLRGLGKYQMAMKQNSVLSRSFSFLR